jgi:hypothetical protein
VLLQFVHRFKDAVPDPVRKPIPSVLRAERKKKKAAKSAAKIQKLLEKCAPYHLPRRRDAHPVLLFSQSIQRRYQAPQRTRTKRCLSVVW